MKKELKYMDIEEINKLPIHLKMLKISEHQEWMQKQRKQDKKELMCIYKKLPEVKKKAKEYHKKYRENNKDKIKQYYEKNKDKIAIKRKQYYEKNKDKIAIKGKQYYEKNKDKIAIKGKQYREKNKDKRKNLTKLELRQAVEDKYSRLKNERKR